jgi:TfoX N-terminal domain
MPYDEALAARIREVVGERDGVVEKQMFGGLAFLVDGRRSVGASGSGGLMVRVAPQETDGLLDRPHVGPFVMRERPIQGWLRVDVEGVATAEALREWVERGLAYARSLPPKAEV